MQKLFVLVSGFILSMYSITTSAEVKGTPGFSPQEGFLIPNIFSPNGDGVNDWFYFPNEGLEDFSLKIFNRWGAQVWSSTSSEIRWDGRTPAGIELPEGVYFWVAEGRSTTPNAEQLPKNGFVTLVR